MREILFRGKSSTTGEWIEGCLVTATVNGETFYLIFADEFTFDNLSVKANKHACVDPETVGQYTGLCDKNGKKIFIGDIITVKGISGFYEVGIDDERLMLNVPRYQDESIYGFYPDESGKVEDYEVVGNIHDNSELLGGTET